MKKTILFLAIFIIAHSGFSQKELSNDYSYNVSAPYSEYKGLVERYFQIKNNFISVKIINQDEVIIQKGAIDKLSMDTEKRYEKFFPNYFEPEDIQVIDDRLFFFIHHGMVKTIKNNCFM
jgi:hypothetical protein